MCEAPRRHASSAFDNHAHFEPEDEPGISAFGYPKTNHGWVECVSTSFPGQTYYFNVDTCCSTWHRPVSRFVPTRVSRPLALMSDDDFLNDAPIEVSDIEDENDYEEEDYDAEADLDLPPDADDVKPPTFAARDPKESADSKIYAEVLFKLYHCYSDDWNDCEIEDVAPLDCETLDDNVSENFASILPETCYSSDSDGSSDSDSESTGSDGQSETITPEEKTSETSETDESFVEVPREDTDEFSEFDCLKVLQKSENDSENDTENDSENDSENNSENDPENNSENESRENVLDVSASSATDSDVGSRQMGLSSDDEEEDEEEIDAEEAEKYQRADGDGRFSLPRLKTIEYADLSKPRKLRKKKWKKRKSNDEESNKTTSNKMIKIVCEVNGVTTVNYDYLAPDLPSGVKMSNLSDSGSSACYDAWYAQRNESANNNCANENPEAAKSFGFLDEPMDFSDPNLSDASSSSSSSSAVSASSSEIRRIRARKAFEEASKLISEANESRHSFKSSSSSQSSWKNSGGDSSDDDD